MGRDDAKAVPGLQGGRAPAQAFAAYMGFAVRNRPVEQFDVTLELPDWQLEPDEEALFGEPDDYYYIDEAGNMVERSAPISSNRRPAVRSRRRARGRRAGLSRSPPPSCLNSNAPALRHEKGRRKQVPAPFCRRSGAISAV